MFSYCVDPKAIEGLMWLSCYVTTAKHMSFYFSFLLNLIIMWVLQIVLQPLVPIFFSVHFL